MGVTYLLNFTFLTMTEIQVGCIRVRLGQNEPEARFELILGRPPKYQSPMTSDEKKNLKKL